jgi:hypothetical protein
MQCKPVPNYPQYKALLLSQAMFVGVFTKQLQKQICAHSSKDTLSTDTHKNSIKLFFLSKTFPCRQHTYYIFLTVDKTVIRRHPKELHYVRYLCSLRFAIFFSEGIFYFREPKKKKGKMVQGHMNTVDSWCPSCPESPGSASLSDGRWCVDAVRWNKADCSVIYTSIYTCLYGLFL